MSEDAVINWDSIILIIIQILCKAASDLFGNFVKWRWSAKEPRWVY